MIRLCPIVERASWTELAQFAYRCDVHRLAAIGVADSPLVERDVFVSAAACANACQHSRVMTAVTNPVTRHPSVMAAAALAIEEIIPGRFVLGIASGDSALWSIGLKPARIAWLRDYILAIKALLRGEKARWRGVEFSAEWSRERASLDVPILVACAGPRVLEMACQTADGVIVSMGFSETDVARVETLIKQACAEVSRDPSSLEVWWYSEVTLADSVEEAMALGLPRFTQWLSIGNPAQKRIPERLRDSLKTLYADAHDLATHLETERGHELVARAKRLGVHDWILEHAACLWGPGETIRARLVELEQRGLENWLLYPNNPKHSSGHILDALGAITADIATGRQ